MLLATATHRKYALVLLAAVVICMLLVGNYAYNSHISRKCLFPVDASKC